MQRIAVPLRDGRDYPIYLGPGILSRAGELSRRAGLRGRVGLIYDAGVGEYAEAVRVSLEAVGLPVVSIPVPSGEASKSLGELGRLWDALAQAAVDREGGLIVLGGGVVGDLGGFAAATYLRGVPFVQVPTTLLAQVDASVGGKTAIDIAAGKNLVGAFHQPSCVIVDPNVLQTLPEREYRSGLAEVVKYGVIRDPELLDYFETNRDQIRQRETEAVLHLIRRSCQIKADVVGVDERESGLRAILNFGHTIGHAVEAVAGYGSYAHGEAVALGMVPALRLSEETHGFPVADSERVVALLRDLGLPLRLREPLATEALLEAMRRDKKSRGGKLRFVLARRLGEMELTGVEDTAVASRLAEIQPAGEAGGSRRQP